MRQIADASALPAPETEGGAWYYIRSLCDPYVVIHSHTGEVFARRDGAKWEEPAYHVRMGREGLVSRTIGSAYADHAQYRPKGERTAA